MFLLSVEERVSNVAKETLTELILVELLQAAEIEDLEGCHAREVNSVSQVHLELFNFFFKVDLIEE